MALGQTAGCPRVNRAKKFMCSPRNTGNINFSLWLAGGLSQGCPDFQKVYVFEVYVPFSCPNFKKSLGMPTLEKNHFLPLVLTLRLSGAQWVIPPSGRVSGWPMLSYFRFLLYFTFTLHWRPFAVRFRAFAA